MKEKFNLFLTSKGITAEAFGKKTAEEMAGLYNEFNETQNAELTKLIEAKVSKEEVETLKASISAAQVEQMKSLNETLKQHGLAIKKLSEAEKAEKKETVSSIRKGLEANVAKIKAMAGADKEGVKSNEFSFKAVGDMTITANVSGGNVPVEQRLSGVNAVASRRVRLMDIVSRGVASSNIISWVYQANKDGAAGGTSEGASKNQIDFDLVVTSTSVKKRTAYIKTSLEMIGDIDFMESEIKNELMRELLKDVENQVFQGDNTGNNLNGIYTTATAFTAGSFAGTVDNANNADVLTVAMNQILIANQEAPNYILMHPSDVTALKLIKASTTDRRYVDRLVMVGGDLTLDGVPIVPTTLVTIDKYLIGNFQLATVYDKGEVSISVGLDGNDFTKNMITTIAEWRGAVIVKNNDRTAFVKGDFSDDKEALETP
jgi:HK97 family phage major capsid protein